MLSVLSRLTFKTAVAMRFAAVASETPALRPLVGSISFMTTHVTGPNPMLKANV